MTALILLGAGLGMVLLGYAVTPPRRERRLGCLDAAACVLIVLFVAYLLYAAGGGYAADTTPVR